jgi:glycogen(starch) synthase
MRVGVISNFYPPNVYGGYEIGCGQICEALRSNGLSVHVLTSKTPGTPVASDTYRWLDSSLGKDFASMTSAQKLSYLIHHERTNLVALRRFIKRVAPDVLYVWNLGYTSRAILPASLHSGIPTGLFAFDYGLTDCGTDVWTDQTRKIPGKSVRVVQICLLNVAGRLFCRPKEGSKGLAFIHYPTQYMKQYLERSGFRAKNWTAIPWGVDTDQFRPATTAPNLKILYVGQIAEHKGVHIAVEALAHLYERLPDADVHLTVAGRCLSPEYQTRLNLLVSEKKLKNQIKFIGFVNRNELPGLYRQHSILIFPSLWEEPMGITILEGMSSGLCVISSCTGGSAELIDDGTNGLSFRNGDSNDLAEKLRLALSDEMRLTSIRTAARATVLAKYRFETTVNSIENHLSRIASSGRA